jgi:hypothetical protein
MKHFHPKIFDEITNYFRYEHELPTAIRLRSSYLYKEIVNDKQYLISEYNLLTIISYNRPISSNKVIETLSGRLIYYKDLKIKFVQYDSIHDLISIAFPNKLCVDNYLCNHFTLYSYFHRIGLTDCVQYLENNNVNIDTICTYKKIDADVHHLITIKPYKLITIENTNSDNHYINKIGEHYEIYYSGKVIKFDNVNKPVMRTPRRISNLWYILNCKSYYKSIYKSFNPIDMVNKIINLTDIDILSINFPNLKYLWFDHNFNSVANELPNTIEHIKFGHRFNQKILNLPRYLRIIVFGNDFNQPINKGVLPSNMDKIIFGHNFNQELVNVLPKKLKILVFGYSFNSICTLPSSLTSLTFGAKYNQDLKVGDLPPRLKHIEFGYYFNKAINSDIFPKTLNYIRFSKHFNNKIKNNIISQLEKNNKLFVL